MARKGSQPASRSIRCSKAGYRHRIASMWFKVQTATWQMNPKIKQNGLRREEEEEMERQRDTERERERESWHQQRRKQDQRRRQQKSSSLSSYSLSASIHQHHCKHQLHNHQHRHRRVCALPSSTGLSAASILRVIASTTKVNTITSSTIANTIVMPSLVVLFRLLGPYAVP